MAKRKAKAKRRVRVRTIDLKRLGSSPARLKRALQQVSRSKIAIIVLNAPFKLGATGPTA